MLVLGHAPGVLDCSCLLELELVYSIDSYKMISQARSVVGVCVYAGAGDVAGGVAGGVAVGGAVGGAVTGAGGAVGGFAAGGAGGGAGAGAVSG